MFLALQKASLNIRARSMAEDLPGEPPREPKGAQGPPKDLSRATLRSAREPQRSSRSVRGSSRVTPKTPPSPSKFPGHTLTRRRFNRGDWKTPRELKGPPGKLKGAPERDQAHPRDHKGTPKDARAGNREPFLGHQEPAMRPKTLQRHPPHGPTPHNMYIYLYVYM